MRSDRAEARPAASAIVHKSVDCLTDGERVEVFAGPYPAIQPSIHPTSLQFRSLYLLLLKSIQELSLMAPGSLYKLLWVAKPPGRLVETHLSSCLSRGGIGVSKVVLPLGVGWELQAFLNFKQKCFFIKLSLSICSGVHPNRSARLPSTQWLPPRCTLMFQKVRYLIGIQRY